MKKHVEQEEEKSALSMKRETYDAQITCTIREEKAKMRLSALPPKNILN